MNGREVDVVGEGQYSNIYVLNLKASCDILVLHENLEGSHVSLKFKF